MKKPLFQEIKEYIKNNIAEGIYKDGERIPTETELAKQFSTSRQTVNKALRDLVLENVVERFPRSGTFVKNTKPQTSIMELRAISDEIRARGNTYSNEIVLLCEIRADEEIARVLNLVKDQKIFMSKVIHKENDVPVRFDVRYIKPNKAPEYLEQDFSDMPPSAYLQNVCPAQKVNNTVEAILPDEELQKHLEIEALEPCLLVSRVVISENDEVSFSKLFYPSSRYKLNSMIEA